MLNSSLPNEPGRALNDVEAQQDVAKQQLIELFRLVHNNVRNCRWQTMRRWRECGLRNQFTQSARSLSLGCLQMALTPLPYSRRLAKRPVCTEALVRPRSTRPRQFQPLSLSLSAFLYFFRSACHGFTGWLGGDNIPADTCAGRCVVLTSRVALRRHVCCATAFRQRHRGAKGRHRPHIVPLLTTWQCPRSSESARMAAKLAPPSSLVAGYPVLVVDSQATRHPRDEKFGSSS